MSGLNEAHTPKARLLGAELRELRDQAGFNGRQLAAALDITQTTVSRYERGARTAPVDYVARVLGLFGVTGQRYDDLIDFARSASEPNLITKPSRHKHLLEISEFERSAEQIVHVAPLVIPGSMQTRGYAKEVMAGLPAEERDLRVELRMARREALSGSRRITTYIAERALRDDLGGPSVMGDQLRRLIEFAGYDSVELRVLPNGLRRWTVAHEGTFVLYRFSKAAPIVQLDHHRGPAFVYEPDDVAVYTSGVETLCDLALSHEQSVKLVTALAEEMEGTSGERASE